MIIDTIKIYYYKDNKMFTENIIFTEKKDYELRELRKILLEVMLQFKILPDEIVDDIAFPGLKKTDKSIISKYFMGFIHSMRLINIGYPEMEKMVLENDAGNVDF